MRFTLLGTLLLGLCAGLFASEQDVNLNWVDDPGHRASQKRKGGLGCVRQNERNNILFTNSQRAEQVCRLAAARVQIRPA